jgi:hypothetical protein
MRRYPALFPLAIFVLFGVALSLIPVSPVLGSAPSQPALAAAPLNNIVRYSHTVMVGSNGTPTQNGAALLAAMDTISNSNPSAANPYLLKLEPGLYDLNGGSLTLNSYVDLEGSGEDVTVISSTVNTPFPPSKGVIMMSFNTEIRFVKVVSTGSVTNADFVGGFLPNTTNVRVNHTTIQVTGGGPSTADYGIFTNGGAVTTTNSTISAKGATAENIAMVSYPSGNQTVQNSFLTGSGSSGFGLNSYGTAKIGSSMISGTNASVVSGGGGTFSCASSYKDTGTAYVALNASCA